MPSKPVQNQEKLLRSVATRKCMPGWGVCPLVELPCGNVNLGAVRAHELLRESEHLCSVWNRLTTLAGSGWPASHKPHRARVLAARGGWSQRDWCSGPRFSSLKSEFQLHPCPSLQNCLLTCDWCPVVPAGLSEQCFLCPGSVPPAAFFLMSAA